MIIGLGYRARQGKNTAATAMLECCPLETQVRVYAFADTLKMEVRKALWNTSDPYWSFLTNTRNSRVSAFLKRVRYPQDEDGCWEWTGLKSEKGYGLFAGSSDEDWRRWRAHRFMWEIVLGNGPAELLRHRCDNRSCVCPAHLEPGTPADNSADMVERGRAQYGEDHHNGHSDELMQDVKEMLLSGRSQAQIVRLSGLSSGTVSRIANGKARVVRPIPKRLETSWKDGKRVTRALLQHYGTEYRRVQDPEYWVKRLRATLDNDNPEVALIADVRFPNEIEAIHNWGGVVVNVTRTTPPDVVVAEHCSESALDGADWDYHIEAATLDELRQKAVDLYRALSRP